MALRVARGLFRLWLVLSVLWIGGVGVWTWLTAKNQAYWGGLSSIEKVWVAVVLALVPPAFVLALGSALVWAFRGLKGAEHADTMNWPKGLWRLWLALSLCWVIFIGVIVWNIEQNHAERWETQVSCVKEEKEKQGLSDSSGDIFSTCAGRSGITAEDFRLTFDRSSVTDTIKSYFKEYGARMFLPPLLTLGLGLLVVWVVSGFARGGAR